MKADPVFTLQSVKLHGKDLVEIVWRPALTVRPCG